MLSDQSLTIWGISHREDNGDPNSFIRRANGDLLKLTKIDSAGSDGIICVFFLNEDIINGVV